MEKLWLINYPFLAFLLLFSLWLYFFYASYRKKEALPWGFGIIPIGIVLSGLGYHFYNNSLIVFSLNLSFVLSLLGVFWNINNIQAYFEVSNKRLFLKLIILGTVSGVFLGISLTSSTNLYTQTNSYFTVASLISTAIQVSLAEEIIFRGFFLSYLKQFQFSAILSVSIQCLVFSILHFQLYYDNWIGVLGVLATGFLAGCFTWKSYRLFSAIALHVTINLIAIIRFVYGI